VSLRRSSAGCRRPPPRTASLRCARRRPSCIDDASRPIHRG
jgi:hypothetical protein